jgi:hypothetical protein
VGLFPILISPPPKSKSCSIKLQADVKIDVHSISREEIIVSSIDSWFSLALCMSDASSLNKWGSWKISKHFLGTKTIFMLCFYLPRFKY